MPFVGTLSTPSHSPQLSNAGISPKEHEHHEFDWTSHEGVVHPRTPNQTADQIISTLQIRILDISNLARDLSKLAFGGVSHSPVLSTPRESSINSNPRIHIHQALPPIATHSSDFDDFDDVEGTLQEPNAAKEATTSLALSSVRHSHVSRQSHFTFEHRMGDGNQDENEEKRSYQHMYSKAFEIKKEWTVDTDSTGLSLAQRSAHTSASFNYMPTTSVLDSEGSLNIAGSYESVESTRGVLNRLISSPANPWRVVWDLCGFALVLYELMSIPLLLAFDPPTSAFEQVMEWIGRIFWTLNVPVSLTTGFISHGVLILRFDRICRNYAKTWMAVDTITVIPDWLFLLLNLLGSNHKENEAGTLVRMINIFRLLRLARLMRIAKLRDAWNMMYDKIVSEKVGILLDVIKNILILMILNHFIACLWFVIGRAQSGESWLTYYRFTKSHIEWGHQYLIAFHWSLTQFASSMHVQPQSVGERTFAIAVVIFGMVGFSYFVGSVTSSLARLRAMDERRATNMWHLRKFLNKEKVNHELCVRIKSYVESRWDKKHKHGTKSTDFDVLELLSENLKSELASAIHGPSLNVHPLFQEFQIHCRQTAQRLLHNGVSTLSLAPYDTMFTAGEQANHMSILTSGTMQYERMHLDSCYPELVEALQDWVAEPVLWVTDWCHIGNLRSRTSAELLLIDPAKLHAISKLNPLSFVMMSSYCKEYIVWLNRFPKEFLSDISQGEDLGTELSLIVRGVLNKLSLKSLLVRGGGRLSHKFRESISATLFIPRSSRASRIVGQQGVSIASRAEGSSGSNMEASFCSKGSIGSQTSNYSRETASAKVTFSQDPS